MAGRKSLRWCSGLWKLKLVHWKNSCSRVRFVSTSVNTRLVYRLAFAVIAMLESLNFESKRHTESLARPELILLATAAASSSVTAAKSTLTMLSVYSTRASFTYFY